MLDAEHPRPLTFANNLAATLSQTKTNLPRPRQMLQADLASLQRILGHAYPDAREAAHSLENGQANFCSKPPTDAAAPIADGTA